MKGCVDFSKPYLYTVLDFIQIRGLTYFSNILAC